MSTDDDADRYVNAATAAAAAYTRRLRSGTAAAAAQIGRALEDPEGHGPQLAAIFHDAGLRDAAVRIAAEQPDCWVRLERAARAAGGAALRDGTPGANGALAVLGAALWGQGRSYEAFNACAAVPTEDGAALLAGLLIRMLVTADADAEVWRRNLLLRVEVADCIAFRRDRPPAAPAPDAVHWFGGAQPDPLLAGGGAELVWGPQAAGTPAEEAGPSL